MLNKVIGVQAKVKIKPVLKTLKAMVTKAMLTKNQNYMFIQFEIINNVKVLTAVLKRKQQTNNKV